MHLRISLVTTFFLLAGLSLLYNLNWLVSLLFNRVAIADSKEVINFDFYLGAWIVFYSTVVFLFLQTII
jgi:hypothetical protein